MSAWRMEENLSVGGGSGDAVDDTSDYNDDSDDDDSGDDSEGCDDSEGNDYDHLGGLRGDLIGSVCGGDRYGYDHLGRDKSCCLSLRLYTLAEKDDVRAERLRACEWVSE